MKIYNNGRTIRYNFISNKQGVMGYIKYNLFIKINE